MDLVVDLVTGDVTVSEPADLRRFAVVGVSPADTASPGGDTGGASGGASGAGPDAGALGALAGALSIEDTGMVEPDGTVLIDPGALRRLAHLDHQLPDGWEAEFDSMLEHAATAGWIAADGSIKAHVEWKVGP